jgi:hypothetical protein
MPLQLTSAQVQALAPDASAVSAGKKLGKPASWKSLGQSSEALWGECQGSALYQTQVALPDLASKCSCPSRKFPCKHALGLLFLAADTPQAIHPATAPEWVTSWHEKRGAAQEKKQARVETAASKPVDEPAQAKRSEKRHEKILAGIDQLDAFMSDLVRQGLARAQGQSLSLWDAQARRLVDAQAPGLATRVRQLALVSGSSESWAERVLAELGQLSLLTHAYRRLPTLPATLAADVRRLVGFSLEQTEVVAHGDVVEDEWDVLGAKLDEEERIRTQRTWLRGVSSQRSALVLQFAPPGGRFTEALVPGSRTSARLAFWPSAAPQRALVVERTGPLATLHGAPPGESIRACTTRFATLLGQLPFLERDLFVLEGVVPALASREGEPAYALIDDEGQQLPLARGDHDVLLATSGGSPLTVVGEWDGYALEPLRAWPRDANPLHARRAS